MKTKLLARRGKSGINREKNALRTIDRRQNLKSKLGSAIRTRKLNSDILGTDTGALANLNLRSVGNKNKRRLLGKVVAAAGRRGRR